MTTIRMTTIRILAAVVATAFAIATGPARAEMKTEWVDYTHGDTKLKAYMVYDDQVTGKRPAIFMVHAREGLTEHAKEQAAGWSKLGYVVFATDMYGMLPKNVDEIVAQTTVLRKDRGLMKARAQAGFDTMIKNPMVDASRIALIGYCFGGTVGIEFGVDRRPPRRQCLDPRLIRRPPAGLGQECQGHVSDPARRRGSQLSARVQPRG